MRVKRLWWSCAAFILALSACDEEKGDDDDDDDDVSNTDSAGVFTAGASSGGTGSTSGGTGTGVLTLAPVDDTGSPTSISAEGGPTSGDDTVGEVTTWGDPTDGSITVEALCQAQVDYLASCGGVEYYGEEYVLTLYDDCIELYENYVSSQACLDAIDAYQSCLYVLPCGEDIMDDDVCSEEDEAAGAACYDA